mmetsp:Transcript_12078/g.24024  ORF Transcript_12078/g.24024 Transcript_12078/m.24024 type:complete len:254 (-) Transcript_12078:32-793(-)
MSVDSRASPVPVSLEEENAGLKAENKRLMSLVSKQREKIKDARLSPTTLMDENKGVEEVEGESDEPKEKAAWPVDDGRHPHGRPKDEMTVRYRFADYLMHELVKRRITKKLVQYFSKWKLMGENMKMSNFIKREKMKIASGFNLIKSERSNIEKMEESVHRIRMEKACLMLINQHKVTLAEKKIDAIRKESEEEKKLMVSRLKEMYYQLVQLNDLESQAVEAAKMRGDIHMSAIGSTTKKVESWFKAGADNKK